MRRRVQHNFVSSPSLLTTRPVEDSNSITRVERVNVWGGTVNGDHLVENVSGDIQTDGAFGSSKTGNND